MEYVVTLQALCLRSIGTRSSLIPSLILNNCVTLRQLDLGIESYLAKAALAESRYIESRTSHQVLNGLMTQIASSSEEEKQPILLPNVDKLKIRGLDLSALVGNEKHLLVDFGALTWLILESCSGLSKALPKLGATQFPTLRSFRIRQEYAKPDILDILGNFLRDLPPLTDLSVLIDGDIARFKLKQILNVHGKTLRSLIMDLRNHKRIVTLQNEDRWQRQCCTEIMRRCPNLVELGIPIDWEDLALGSCDCKMVREIIRYRSNDVHLLTSFGVHELYERMVTRPPNSKRAQCAENEWACHGYLRRHHHQRSCHQMDGRANRC